MDRTPLSARWRGYAALAAALACAVITACGGGGDAGPMAASPGDTAAAVATAYAAGPITGFGSVIVNGVRFDDSRATVTDDDDRARARDLLRLGMHVEVDARALSASNGTGEALRIRYGSEIVGPVDAAPGAASLKVLGQTVNVTATTVFDSALSGGLAAIKAGDVLEIHAQYVASTQSYTATRIESATGATTYKLRGTVSNLTATTFSLGTLVVDYGAVAPADLPANLANGLTVRVRLQTAPDAQGRWIATSVRTGVRKVEDRPDGHVRGPVTAWASARSFEINGLKVDGTHAAYPDGTDGVVLGAIVEVEGSIVNGVLVATKVEIDGRHAMERHGFELHGAVGNLDTAAKTFVLRGVKVSYGGTVAWSRGTEADLANGRKLEVKGTPSADRTALTAIAIKFED